MDTTSNNESELTIAMDRLIFNMGRWSRGIDELAKEIREYEAEIILDGSAERRTEIKENE